MRTLYVYKKNCAYVIPVFINYYVQLMSILA